MFLIYMYANSSNDINVLILCTCILPGMIHSVVYADYFFKDVISMSRAENKINKIKKDVSCPYYFTLYTLLIILLCVAGFTRLSRWPSIC